MQNITTIKNILFILFVALFILSGCSKQDVPIDKKDIFNNHDFFLENCSPFGVGNYSYCKGKNAGIFFQSPIEGRPILKVEGADPETFMALNAYFNVSQLGKDKNAVYMGEKKIEIIKDPESIKIISIGNHDYLLKDKYHSYGYDLLDKEKNIWGVKIIRHFPQ